MGVSDRDAAQYIDHLETLLPKNGIADSRLRLAHFFAQVLHESGCMRFDMENLNYSAEGLRKVFGKYFHDQRRCRRLCPPAREDREQGLCEPYGQRSEASGDGWKYRGRGLIQLDRPEQLQGVCRMGRGRQGDGRTRTSSSSEYAVHSAVFFWDKHNLNHLADKDDVVG